MAIHDRMRGLCDNANAHKKWKKIACAEYAQYFRFCYSRTGRLRRLNTVIGQMDRRTRDRLILAADEQLVARYAVGEGQLLHGEEGLAHSGAQAQPQGFLLNAGRDGVVALRGHGLFQRQAVMEGAAHSGTQR